MKLFSWNVNGLRAVLKKDALQQFIACERPDVLCLQEIKARPEQVDYDFPGYQIFWHSATRPGYSGTAILVADTLSRQPVHYDFTDLSKKSASIKSDATLPSSKKSSEDESSSLAETLASTESSSLAEMLALAESEGRVLVLDFERFYLVNVYTPNSKPDLSRLHLRETVWDIGFLQLLQTLAQSKPIVTCGDFNAAHHEIDLARPQTNHHSAGFTDEERRGITHLIAAGFLDTFRTLHPGAVRYTWWSHWGQARAHNVGWRIDYFFISESLRPQLQSAEIYESVTGSDHCPVSVTLEF